MSIIFVLFYFLEIKMTEVCINITEIFSHKHSNFTFILLADVWFNKVMVIFSNLFTVRRRKLHVWI
jgi:hypothetical protein